jgi:hypothetical protein
LLQPDLESIFLAKTLKILLQHNLPRADIGLLIRQSYCPPLQSSVIRE